MVDILSSNIDELNQFEDAEEETTQIDKITTSITPVEELNQNNSNDDDYYDEDYDDIDSDIGENDPGMVPTRGPNCQARVQIQSGSSSKRSFQPNQKTMDKYIDKINIDKYEPITTKLNNNLEISHSIRGKDKADRATVEQVLDPRTRMIIFKMIQRGVFNELNGCISTGKEANVYHATTNKSGQDYAVKVYKTSILTFKDRDKYVSGEFRFRHGYCRSNPRKMVKTWAEKEFRNLARIKQVGIVCPEPIFLRSHVLVMEFIGESGFPAPLLKDADIDESEACKLYLDSVKLIHRIFNLAKLVHADLSEFNMLYDKGEIVVIDVSQSVEHDHPHALEFLRKDCTNINDFFKKKNVPVMTLKELFDFVTDPTVNEENMDDYLEKSMYLASNRETTEKEKVDDEVFKNSYIPHTMDDVVDIERDFRRAKLGESLIYSTLHGLKNDLSTPRTIPKLLEEDKPEGTEELVNKKEEIESSDGTEEEDSEEDEDSNDEDEDEDDNTDENNNDSSVNSIHNRPRDESPNSRKLRKQAVREEKAEKRLKKTPKHVKKRAIKQAQIRKHK